MNETVYRILNLIVWIMVGFTSLFYLFTLMFTFNPMFPVMMYITIKSFDNVFYFWFTTIAADCDCPHHGEKE